MRHFFIFLSLLLLTACSTTEKIPEGEQLYVGISKVSYSDAPEKKKAAGVRRDSVGVITTISDAVKAVDDALTGGDPNALLDKLKEDAKGGSADAKKAEKEEKKLTEKENAAVQAAIGTAREEVEAVLAYPPNNALFGSSYHRSPLQLGLWFYNGFADAKTAVGKWIFKCFAKQPVLVSTVSPEMRAKVAQNTLRNYGFFRSTVGYDVQTQKNPKKARIGYNVVLGPVSLLDSIQYMPFGQRQDSLLVAGRKAAVLKSGEAFSVVNLAAERTRIGELMRNNGYYFWQDAYTTYQADTVQRRNYVQLRVMPSPSAPSNASKQWKMGRAYISVSRQGHENEMLTQELRRRQYTFRFSGDKIPLRPTMWRHAIAHRTGQLYRADDQKTTIEKLGAIGVFSQMDVNYIPADTAATCDTLDFYVTAVMDKPYDSDLEMNATLKSNQQIGPGLSYSINKRNAFRGGETVSLKLYGSYEWQLNASNQGDNSLLNSYELGAQLAFKFPRFVAPFISKRRLRFPAETTFALDADWRRRAGFFTMISAGASATYSWHKHSNALHELRLLSIDFDKTFATSHAFDSIMAANPALYVSMRDQFIPSISYTFTYKSAPHHHNPVMVQLTAKESGNLISGFYKAAGRNWTEPNKTLLGSPFAQFVKATAEFHYSHKFNKRFSVATRLFGGAVWSYGNSRYAPYSDQFYVGGANSVRGFTVRTIGPGSYRSSDSKYAYLDQTGDIKLEANVELRAKLFGSLNGAVFLDAGNVWLMRNDPLRPGAQLTASTLKNIAVGTGFGLRYDLEFIVLRLDLGIGLHTPYETSKPGFYNLERFKDGLNLHFAIGYPF